MTPQEREVIQMAIDALDEASNVLTWDGFPKAAEALRAALAQPEQEQQWRDAAYRAMDLVIEQQAQPEQEPVTQVQVAEDYYPHIVFLDGVDTTSLDQKFLYTAPPQRERIMCGCGDQIMPDDGAECGTCVTARNAVQREWQGLTDEEVQQLFGVGKVDATFMQFTRAIEAKLREKNK